MSDPIPAPPETKPRWPQEGILFYLLWVGGLVAFSIVSRVVMYSATPVLQGEWVGRLVFVGLAMLLHGWQAWLLFRSPVRGALWTLLPLLSLVTGNNYKLIQLFGVLIPILETPILAGVRLRPWAWLLAGMGQVILAQAGYAVFPGLADFLVRQLGSAPGQIRAILIGALYSGWWLLLEAMAAVVLAWWMPPVATRGSGTAPPPLAGSTGG